MQRLLLFILILIGLSGCAIGQKSGYLEEKPKLLENKLIGDLDLVPPPVKGKLTVAVYSFKDQTGQRKATPGIASFSTAVTQGADNLLIRALQDVSKGEWFEVVERSSLDNLTKERLIVTQMRQAYEGQNAQKLMPLKFAGLIFEGGIIGYDSGKESGGSGYNFLGIGPTTQYSKDVITISLRAVSVNTGKIVAAVTVTKVVYSTSDTIAIFKSVDPGSPGSILQQVIASNTGSQSGVAGIFQFESGVTINEPITIALKAAIETAVIELIKEGESKGVWECKVAGDADSPWWEFKRNGTSKSADTVRENKKEETALVKKDEQKTDLKPQMPESQSESKVAIVTPVTEIQAQMAALPLNHSQIPLITPEIKSEIRQETSPVAVSEHKPQTQAPQNQNTKFEQKADVISIYASKKKFEKSPSEIKQTLAEPTRVYLRKSDLNGPLVGPFETLMKGTLVKVQPTELEDILEVQIKNETIGFVKKDKIKVLGSLDKHTDPAGDFTTLNRDDLSIISKEDSRFSAVKSGRSNLRIDDIILPTRSFISETTLVYLNKSDLNGPLMGPHETILKGTEVKVKPTEFKDVLEIKLSDGSKAYVKANRIKNELIEKVPVKQPVFTLNQEKQVEVPADEAAKMGFVH